VPAKKTATTARPDADGAPRRRNVVPPHHESASIAAAAVGPYVAVPLGQRLEKLSEQIARRILHEISSRHLEAGATLPTEATMCATYGVGRPTLREALRILEVNGLLVIRPGPRGGPQVVAPTPTALARVCTLHFQAMGVLVHDLALARASTEGTLAAMAATSIDTEGRSRLVTCVESGELGSDQTEVLGAGYEFHSVVMSLAANPVLREWGLALQEAFNARLGRIHPPESLDEVRRDHREIAQAIFEKDAPAAERAMARHWSHTLESAAVLRAGSLPVEWT
jgi:GntR family transcriptional repressor for pyruvate dehydrogenase complex